MTLIPSTETYREIPNMRYLIVKITNNINHGYLNKRILPTHNNGIKDISMNTGIELYSKEIPIPPNPRIRMS